MKSLLKTFLLLVLVIVLGLTALVFAHNSVAKAAMEIGVRAVTGMPLSMGKFDLNFSKSSVDIENLIVKNPSGFHDTSLLEIPKIFVAYDLSGFFKGEAHLKGLEFEMSQFTVVKNEKGALNLDRLRTLQGTQKPSAQRPGQGSKTPAKPIPIQIDMMRLKIGKVVYVDYASGNPAIREFRINFDQSFQNITDLNSVMRLIVLKAMMSSGISNLVNFDVQGLAGSLVNDSTQLATWFAEKGFDTMKTAAENPSQIGGMLQNAPGSVESAAKDVTSEVKSAASAIKNKFKIPF
jgi:hypothetical protein